jgi:adenylate kinase
MNTDTILKRYDTYMETTRPVLDYYSKNLNFHEINGTQEIDQITRKLRLLSMFKTLTLGNLII